MNPWNPWNEDAVMPMAAVSHSHGNPTLALTNLTGTTASASNGFTLSLSADAGGPGGSGFAAQGSGAYTQNTGTIQFANSNGITFGLSTDQMTASHNGLTTAAQSDHSHGNPSLALTNLTGTTSSASNGFTLSLSAAAPGAGGGFAAQGSGAYTQNTGTIQFANSNGITFGLSTNQMTASHDGLTTARASTDAIGLNTAATQVTWTVNSSGISLNAGAYLTIAQPPGAYLTTAAQSDHSHGNPTLALTNLTGTTASASNGLTLSLSAAAPGAGGGATASYFSWPQAPLIQATTVTTLGGSSMFVQPFVLPFYVSASYVRLPLTIGFGSTVYATSANNSQTMRQTCTYFVIFYTQLAGASSRSLGSYASSSLSMVLQVRYHIGAASGNQTCSHDMTYGVTGNSSVGFATNYSPAASSAARISTTHLTAHTGHLHLDVPFASSLTPGNYWIGVQISSASATTGGVAAMGSVTSRGSFVEMTQANIVMREMGANTTASTNAIAGYGHGFWSTNTLGRTSASLALSHISTMASQPILPFQMIRHA